MPRLLPFVLPVIAAGSIAAWLSPGPVLARCLPQQTGVRVSGVLNPVTPNISIRLRWRSEPPPAPPEPPPEFGQLAVRRDPRELRSYSLITPAGEFAFNNVPPGDFTLEALTVQNVTWDGGIFQNVRLPQPGLRPTVWASVPITVGQTPIDALVVRVQPGLELSGRIELTDAPPVPFTPSIEEMDMEFLRADDRTEWWQIQVRVDVDGRFTASGFNPGLWLVRASGARGQVLQSVRIAGQDFTDKPFDVGVSNVPALVLSFTNLLGAVEGTVTNGVSSMVPTARVVMFPADRATWDSPTVSWGRGHRERFQDTSVRPDGAFLMHAVEGEYYVAAIQGSTRTVFNRSVLERLAPQATRVSVNTKMRAQVVLRTIRVP